MSEGKGTAAIRVRRWFVASSSAKLGVAISKARKVATIIEIAIASIAAGAEVASRAAFA